MNIFLLFKHLALLLFYLLSTMASAQAQDSTSVDSTIKQQKEFPCNISIVGDFESECILPFEKNWYYNEEPNTLIACQGMKVVYTAYVDKGGYSPDKWEWEVAGEDSFTDNGNGSITVIWSNGTTAQLRVTIYWPDGIACTKTVNVRLIEKPHISVMTTPAYTEVTGGSKVIYVCKGETVEFTELSSTTNTDIVGYYWESMMGGTSSTPNYRIENVWTNDQVIHRVYNNCGCYDEEIYEIQVLTGEILELGCYGTVCEGARVTYTANSPACDQYFWYVEGGTVVDGQNTPQVTVQWDSPQNGYGVIAIDGNLCGNNSCPTMLSKKIPIIENNLSIKGQTTACEGETVIYSIPLFGSTEYHWSITPNSGVTQVAEGGANEQMYIFNQAGTYQISVSYKCDFLECGEFTSAPLTVTVKPKLTISGEDRLCITNPCSLTTSPATIADWTVYDMSSSQVVSNVSSQSSLALLFPQPGKYLIVAHNAGYCRDAEFILTVQDAPLAPTIYDLDPNNPHTSCPNSGILLKANPSNPNYTIVWESVCNSGTPSEISGNEVTINYGNTVCNVAAYTYDRMLGCRSANAYVHTVTERLPLPINITSPITVCPGTKITWDNAQVPYQEGFLYKWKIQESMQHCTSIQGNALSNDITLVINNFESANYPINFFMTLERKYCNQKIYDTVRFIIDEHTPEEISIQSDTDTVCIGTMIHFSGSGGDATAYRWKTDESNTVYSGASFSHMFTRSGDHTVTLMYSTFDYCTNTQYFATTTKQIHVLPRPYSSGIYMDSYNNVVGVHVPTPNNYSYEWYYNNSLMSDEHGESVPYLGFGCYKCIITNSQTGCGKTVTKCFHSVPNPCDSAGWNIISYDTCSTTLYLKTQVVGNPTRWSVTGGQYTISYLNSRHTEANITFREATTYFITAYTTGNNCETANYIINVPFIPNFTFEKQCDKIIIYNKSLYQDGTTPIVMNVNGAPDVSFHAHDNTYSYPVPSNGSYTFQLVQPYHCDLGTIVFDDISNELSITASNGSENPVRTCENTPLFLTASWLSGMPIDSTLWEFSDGTYYKAVGGSFHHTYQKMSDNYTVTAKVENQNGCLVSKSTLIKSFAHSIESGGLYAPGNLVCPYVSNKLLTFSSLNYFFDANNSTYYQWNIGNYPHSNSRPTFFTANYTVVVTDDNFCKEHAQLDVLFKTRPTAIIIADKYNCCIGDKVKLYGAPGSDSNDYVFAWDILDPNGNHTTPSSASTSFAASVAGTYQINLKVTNNQGCDADATTVYITVHPTPPAPSIQFGSRLCLDDPPVEIFGSSPITNDLHWSNGNLGTASYYFTPGVATAWYYDLTSGCKSDKALITIDAQPDFDALLTGCYEKCPQFFDIPRKLPVWNLLQNQQEIDWHWILNNDVLDNNMGIDTVNPLLLKLSTFGNYFLEVLYNNNNCSIKSPLFSIKQKERCNCENVSITTNTTWFVKDCHLYYDINVTACNNSDVVNCFKDLKPLFETDYMNMVWTDFGGANLAPGECFSFNILLEVSQFTPSHTAVFQLFDDCFNCTTEFSICLMPEHIECVEEMFLDWFEVRFELSSSTAAYFNFKLNISPSQNLIAFWIEPPMVINYWYDGVASVQGLGIVDYATLTQLMTRGGKICFYAISCEGNKLCKRKVCISAEKIYDILRDLGLAKSKTSHDNGDGYTKQMRIPTLKNAHSPRLLPNPTTGEVKIIESTYKISEVRIMDINGRQVDSFINTSIFNISSLSSGIYIVCVKTIHDSIETISYLKLVKK